MGLGLLREIGERGETTLTEQPSQHCQRPNPSPPIYGARHPKTAQLHWRARGIHPGLRQPKAVRRSVGESGNKISGMVA